MLRILGCVNQYNNMLDVVIENLDEIKTFRKELVFHKSLQANQRNMKNSKIQDLLQVINNYDNINEGLDDLNRDYLLNSQKVTNFTEKQKIYSHNRKNFANQILAFFHKYSLDDEIGEEHGYIIIPFDSLFNSGEFNQLKNEFCIDNKIQDHQKFLMESLSLLEENSMGTIDSKNKRIEIKVDDEVNQKILKMLQEKPNGLSYSEIFDRLSKIYDNFFMDDFVKFLLEGLCNNQKIQQISNNFYQIL